MVTKAPRKTSARPARGEAETQQEFEAIRSETEAAHMRVDAKSAEAAKLQEAEIRSAVQDVTVEGVVRKIAGLGLEMSRALAEISEKLTAEVHQLALVREAVALERGELERLHKIDVAATALDHMVQDYALRKQQLEAEIAKQRAAFEDETASAQRERKDQEEALKKQRQREIDEYEYKKALDRKKAQDKYDEDVRLREKANQDKQEALEKGWTLREVQLKEQEEELLRLRDDVQGFPAQLAKEVDAAAERGRREAEVKLEQKIVMLEKDAATETRLSELRVKSLEESLKQSATTIAGLEKQLAEAKQQVQDIAVRAIEGASGARALSHINQIAMEQAKNRPQG